MKDVRSGAVRREEVRVATITLNRPERRNAQNPELLDLLNDCWERAAADDEVRVILLRAEGPHFSAGHDMSGVKDKSLSSIADTISDTGTLALYRWESKRYLGYSRRWREIPKPSITPPCKAPASPAHCCWYGPATSSSRPKTPVSPILW